MVGSEGGMFQRLAVNTSTRSEVNGGVMPCIEGTQRVSETMNVNETLELLKLNLSAV